MSRSPLLIPLVLMLLLGGAGAQLRWSQITFPIATSPPPRRDCAMGYDPTRNQLIIFGGRPGPLNDTWIFSLTTGTWREVVTVQAPEARFSFVGGVYNNAFYIATGEGSSAKFFNDIWRFDLALEQWFQLPAQQMPSHHNISSWADVEKEAYRPTPRYGSVGGVYPGASKFFVHQGFSSRRFFDTNVYNLDPNSYGWMAVNCPGTTCNEYNPSYPHARCLHGGTMVSPEDFVIFGGCMTGGKTGGPCPSGDSWYYSGTENMWTRIGACPSPRIYSTMAMLPSVGGQRRVVLYGGNERNKQVVRTTESTSDEVAILNVEELQWKIVKTLGTAPRKRLSSAMVTGPTGIYMFGGQALDGDSGVLSDLWLLQGDTDEAEKSEMKECPMHFINLILLHGVFMVGGWGVFLTWGAFVARYFNSTGKTWFYVHVSFQIFGLVLNVVGFALGVVSVQFDDFKFDHGIIGLVVFLLGILQPFNALVRPARAGYGEPRTLKRKIWELIHHFGGRIAIVLALINISLGVFISVAHKAVWITWFVYLSLLVLIFFVAEYVQNCTKDKHVKHFDDRLDYDTPYIAKNTYDNTEYNSKIYPVDTPTMKRSNKSEVRSQSNGSSTGSKCDLGMSWLYYNRSSINPKLPPLDIQQHPTTTYMPGLLKKQEKQKSHKPPAAQTDDSAKLENNEKL